MQVLLQFPGTDLCLGNSFGISVPDWDLTEKLIIKKLTYQCAEELKVPYPVTLFPQYVEEVKVYSDIVKYPCIVKPYQSHKYYDYYNRKMTIVNNSGELLKHTEDAMMNGIDVMIQEMIPGDDTQGINFNSFSVNGQISQMFFARKVRLSHSGFGIPLVVKSIPRIPEVEEYAEKLLSSLNFTGFSCVEFKYDYRDNKYKLMEINGRNNRSGLLALKAGINFPLLEYNYLTSGAITPTVKYKSGIYWIQEFRDLESMPVKIFKENYGLLNFFRPYYNRHVFAIFSIKDLAPFKKRLMDAFNLIFTKSNSVKKNNSNRHSTTELV